MELHGLVSYVDDGERPRTNEEGGSCLYDSLEALLASVPQRASPIASHPQASAAVAATATRDGDAPSSLFHRGGGHHTSYDIDAECGEVDGGSNGKKKEVESAMAMTGAVAGSLLYPDTPRIVGIQTVHGGDGKRGSSPTTPPSSTVGTAEGAGFLVAQHSQRVQRLAEQLRRRREQVLAVSGAAARIEAAQTAPPTWWDLSAFGTAHAFSTTLSSSGVADDTAAPSAWWSNDGLQPQADGDGETLGPLYRPRKLLRSSNESVNRTAVMVQKAFVGLQAASTVLAQRPRAVHYLNELVCFYEALFHIRIDDDILPFSGAPRPKVSLPVFAHVASNSITGSVDGAVVAYEARKRMLEGCVARIPLLLSKFHGCEEDLFRLLKAKYNTPAYRFEHFSSVISSSSN